MVRQVESILKKDHRKDTDIWPRRYQIIKKNSNEKSSSKILQIFTLIERRKQDEKYTKNSHEIPNVCVQST